MPRRRRHCPPGLPVHVVQRGNNRQTCFTSDADRKAYAHWLRESTDKYGVDLHAWVFMTNHVHLLLTPRRPDAVSHCMQYLGRNYVRYFNQQHGRTGTLFEGRFKSSLVQTRQYLLTCQRYIELNPVRAGMVTDPGGFAWSSYRAHAFNQPVKMWHPHADYLALGATAPARMAAYRSLFAGSLPGPLVREIRAALKTGLVLGNDRFRDEIEALTGQCQRPGKRGPRAVRRSGAG